MPNSASPLREEQRLFPVPPDQLGAAHSWFEHGERTPRKPRLASSVVLVRDGPAGTETYLGYRSGSSPLGTVAFPGGSLDDADGEPVTWFGPSPAKWAESMGISDHRIAQAHVVAAIRELFEETGVLLAGPIGLRGLDDVAGLPLVVLVVGGLSVLTAPVAHAMSRALERSADRFALDVTRNPTAFISAMRRLGAQTASQLAAATGIPSAVVGALLANDIRKGVVRFENRAYVWIGDVRRARHG